MLVVAILFAGVPRRGRAARPVVGHNELEADDRTVLNVSAHVHSAVTAVASSPQAAMLGRVAANYVLISYEIRPLICVCVCLYSNSRHRHPP